MHHYDFHIGDYMKATAHLSNEEDLCYRRLLDMYYDTEAPIPLETGWVARRLRIGTDLVISVLRDFFVEREDGWHSARCDEEIAAYHARAEQARANGKYGGRPKKTNPVTDGFRMGSGLEPDGNQPETGLKANHEPVTSNQEPVTKNQGKPAPSAASPSDPLDFIWSVGVQVLGEKGRSLLGKARKELGDQKVTEILAQMASMKPPVSDPIPYFIKATKPQERRFVA